MSVKRKAPGLLVMEFDNDEIKDQSKQMRLGPDPKGQLAVLKLDAPVRDFTWENMPPYVKLLILQNIASLFAHIPIGPPCWCISSFFSAIGSRALDAMQTLLDASPSQYRVLPTYLATIISDYIFPSTAEILFNSVVDPWGETSFIVASFGWCNDQRIVNKHDGYWVDEDGDLPAAWRFPCSSYIIANSNAEPDIWEDYLPLATFGFKLDGNEYVVGVYDVSEMSQKLFWKYGGIHEENGFPYIDEEIEWLAD
jgi:hypothetical protein